MRCNSRTDRRIGLGFSALGRAWALVVQEGLSFSDGPTGGSVRGSECLFSYKTSLIWHVIPLGTQEVMRNQMAIITCVMDGPQRKSVGSVRQ